ncbi:MAG TPA: hypothetical protein VFX24_02350 [Ktedonobacterales bacterium]|jgi:hypothetical protein|nr:hypothetical protein [Ktedonobacterales bacterium]
MSLYALALFAHLVGVFSLFIGMGLQWVVIIGFRKAQAMAQMRLWSGLLRPVAMLGPLSAVLILLAGGYMMFTAWGIGTPWIVVSIGAMLLMAALGMGITVRKLRIVQRTAMGYGLSDEISPELRHHIYNPMLWISAHLASGIALSIVFLMTTKPGWLASLLVMAVAMAMGAIIGATTAKPRRNPATVASQPDFEAITALQHSLANEANITRSSH